MSSKSRKEKFTPGPWYAYAKKTDFSFIRVDNGDTIVHWKGFDCPDVSMGENIANARLIAAAPEMYEALNLIVEHSDSDLWPEDLDLANRALQKARGDLCIKR